MPAENVVKENQKYKIVPPDGGYGYVILFAVSVNFIATLMFSNCFGMIFSDLFTKLGMGSTAVTVLTGINAMSIAFSAFLTGPLLKLVSRRKLALVGSLFYNAGVVGVVFVNTQAQLILCQGFLQSFGFGFLYNVSCTMLNEYFLDKRLFSMSFAQTLSALASMVAPMVVSWTKAEYGFHGTLVVIAAVSMQTFIASALLQPVAWHMKKVVVEDVQEKKLLLQMEKSVNEQSNKLLQTPLVKLHDIEASDLFAEKKENFKPSNADIVITWLKNFLDWPLFKKFALTCGCLGPPVVLFADATTAVYFLAQFLYDLHWDHDQVKWALALIGFGDIAARIVFILSSSWLNRLGSHAIYVAGILIAIVTRLGLLWVSEYVWALAIFIVMGVSRCSITMLYPMVVSDSVTPEEFPSAIGISLMIFGIISIVMGPVVGAIRDATGNYTTMFLILIGFMIVTAVVWIIELVQRKRKISRTEKTEIN